MMSKLWKLDDGARISGATGALREAARIAAEALERGPCSITASEVADAKKLAEGAAVLLGNIREPTWNSVRDIAED